jgi:hypothetical protein
VRLEFRRISDCAWVDTTERFCLSCALVCGEWVYTAARRATKKDDEDDGYVFKWEPICTSKDLDQVRAAIAKDAGAQLAA